MRESGNSVPAIMAFGGLDPTGASGLAADIEAIASLGGHALPVATAITVQDSSDLQALIPVSQVDLIGQSRAVLKDVPVSAFKIGLLGSVAAIEAVHTLVVERPGVPLVLDPICICDSGTAVADEEQLDALASLLLPHALVVTPRLHEARLLAPEADSPGAMAQQLLSYGCEHVLLSDTGPPDAPVENRLYGSARLIERFRFERLPGRFRGAGCTLAAALATLLAHGVETVMAAHQAQQYTFDALAGAWEIGRGCRVPDRLHWAGDRSGT